MNLLTQLSDVTPLCVENNTMFTQILENNRHFVRNKRILCSGTKTVLEAVISSTNAISNTCNRKCNKTITAAI